MWARKRLDLAWSDLAFGALRSVWPGGDRARLEQQVEAHWSGGPVLNGKRPHGNGPLSGESANGTSASAKPEIGKPEISTPDRMMAPVLPAPPGAFACLSVRSGFDLLLGALDLPPSSEVLVSAVTIRDMVRIIEHHGLVAVPVDLDPELMAPHLESLRRVLTPATRVLLVAHLFGGRIHLDPLIDFARRNGLILVEDCAQAYSGSDYLGHAGVDVSMFSFGPIKTATALGGAVLRVHDSRLLARMRQAQAAWPVQPRWTYFKRVAKYFALRVLSTRFIFGLFVSICRGLGKDYDKIVNGAVRGFAGDGFFERIRHRPSVPLLSLLLRRLNGFRRSSIDARARGGQAIIRLLDAHVRLPGAGSLPHHFWVFPVLVAEPERTIAALRAARFDATQGQSLYVVEPPRGRPGSDPKVARATIGGLVYLPCYRGISGAVAARMAQIVNLSAGVNPLVDSCVPQEPVPMVLVGMACEVVMPVPLPPAPVLPLEAQTIAR